MLSQLLPGRADIGIAFLIIGEVGAREGPIGALRLVEHRDVRLDPALVDQPGEHLGQAMSVSAARREGVTSSRLAVRSIIVLAAVTSACRTQVVASTSMITACF